MSEDEIAMHLLSARGRMTADEKRIPGYYWICVYGDWEISQWNGTSWAFIDSEGARYPVDEVDERRLERFVTRQS